MYLCYVDESGDLGALPLLPAPTGNDQPVLVLGALFIDASRLETLTNDFLNLKYRFFPGLAYPSLQHLDRIIPEIKGADLRSNALRGNRNQQRQAYGFIDKVLGLLETHHVRLVVRIWIKGLGQPFDSKAVYTSSIQAIYSYFDNFLTEQSNFGFCITDSRNKPKNVNVSHSIFTQKFQSATSFYSRVLELPTFSHSDNHAGLQLCDLLCSALVSDCLRGVLHRNCGKRSCSACGRAAQSSVWRAPQESFLPLPRAGWPLQRRHRCLRPSRAELVADVQLDKQRARFQPVVD